MSSSRVHTTLTGPSTCCAMRTAVTTMSGSSLRPKPPPIRWLWTMTLSTGSPAAFAASDCTRRDDLRAEPDLAGVGREMNRGSSSAPSSRARETAARTAPRSCRLARPLAISPDGFGDRRRPFRWRRADRCQMSFELMLAFGPRPRSRPAHRGPSWRPTCDRRPPRPDRPARRPAARRELSSPRCHRRGRPCRRTPGTPRWSRTSCPGSIASMP